MSKQDRSQEQGTIQIVGAVSGQARTRTRDIVERAVEITEVRKKFEGFVNNLSEIVDVEVAAVGGFELDEVQFSAEISANGDFKLLGTGVGVEATSGVSFTLKRRSTKGIGKQTNPVEG